MCADGLGAVDWDSCLVMAAVNVAGRGPRELYDSGRIRQNFDLS